MSSIKDIAFNGKRALIRVDFNVPLNRDGVVTDATRIKAALPTINYVLNNGGSVVLMSHLGRPKAKRENKFSLQHLVKPLKELLGKDVQFVADCIGDEAVQATSKMNRGAVILLENLRFHGGEKSGDDAFAKQLAQHGDCYINDAFGTAHRDHASTSRIAQFFQNNKYFGLLLEKEIKAIDEVIRSNASPKLAIIGGAKVSSKITVIENLLDAIDALIIGGGMAYTFVKAKGGAIGNSLVEDDYLETARTLLQKAQEKNVTVHLPLDTVAADDFNNEANRKTVPIDAIEEGWMGLDIGPKSITHFEDDVIQKAKTILWNGPMGVFEMSNFQKGTVSIAQALAQATENGAYTLVGGGDSVAALNKFELADKVSYVSTGGGALLEYLEGKSLPGIKAILT
ncbi:MAG: phosphoglycerate kinase [Bacteroidota bacterium]